ncbi:MAG: FGGY-family carbohydrate kinase [bacterium]|nr:FGGY-family carbohydrate kinase [bacterium]
MTYILTFDVGTTSVKCCLFSVGAAVTLVDGATRDHPIRLLPGGGAEQDPDDWWAAMVEGAQQIAAEHPEQMAQVAGVSFCSQMQSLVLLDSEARPVRPAMSYMDQRAERQMRSAGGRWPRVAGLNVGTLARSLWHTGAAPASVKDPVWKYHWVREHEPEAFARAHKWVDVKEALIARMTGRFVMSEDSAFATLLSDRRSASPRFSPAMLKMLGVDPAHMPEIVAATDQVGGLLEGPAAELGLRKGTPVFAGGGDAAAITVGAGATGLGETHVYVGTSGWVSTVTDRMLVDVSAMVAAVVGAVPGRYNYFAELETAGKCLEWVRDHLALDEINIYLSRENVADDPEAEFESLYDYLSQVIDSAPAGAGGVLFTPWLHGNRCPFEDPNARGMFFNISLETGKTELLRAVVEGVCLHLRWFVETQERKLRTSRRVRFVGGAARSAVTSQILADVLQRGVDVVERPQDVGAVGAALIAAVGLGIVADVETASRLVPVVESFEPREKNRAVYDHAFAAFTKLYPATKKVFAHLNASR